MSVAKASQTNLFSTSTRPMQNADEDSMNFVQAHTVDVGELMNLSTFDLEGALVIPLDLDPLTS